MGFELGTDGPIALVVGVDGSETSLRAAAYAAGLARRQRTRLVIVYARRQPPTLVSIGDQSGIAIREVLAAQDEVERQLRDALRHQTRVWRIDAQLVVRDGDPLAVLASRAHSLSLYLVGFIALFVFSGIGNGSTYKMIPMIFPERRLAAAVIGIAGAIGAFGGVLVNIAFRQSFLAYHNANAAYLTFIAFYLLCVLVTWAVYLRRAR